MALLYAAYCDGFLWPLPYMNTVSGNESIYKLLTGESSYRQAIDTVLELAISEIAIFDYDLAALRLEEPYTRRNSPMRTMPPADCASSCMNPTC